MTIALALVVLVPLSLAVDAVVSHSDQIAAFVAAAPSFRLPPAPAWLGDIPLVGDFLSTRWQHLAQSEITDVLRWVKPYIGTVTQWFVHAAGSFGTTLLHLTLTIVFSAILYARGEKAASVVRALRPAARRARAARRWRCWAPARSAASRSAWW